MSQQVTSMSSKRFLRFSARSRHFQFFFGVAKIGASATRMEGAGGGGGEERKENAHHDFEKRPFDTFAVG